MAKDIIIGNMESSIYDPDNKQKELVFNDEVVKNTGNQTIAGTKTFTSSPIVPTPTTDMEVATKKYVDDNAGGGGLSWGSSITGTSGTGLTTTIGNNASAGTIGQSIVAGNTQTNVVTLLNLDTGTSDSLQTGINIKALNTARFPGGYNNGAISVNNFTSNTQNLIHLNRGFSWCKNFNTNSSYGAVGIYLEVENNLAGGYNGCNTGIDIINKGTVTTIGSTGYKVGIYGRQTGVGGTFMIIDAGSNVNSNTTGIVNYTLSNTQSGATVMQKIDLGTSAQGHTGLQILTSGASTSQRGITINTSSTGTGIPIELITTGTDRTALKLSTGFTSTTAPTGASTYINVGIGGTMYRILAQAVS